MHTRNITLGALLIILAGCAAQPAQVELPLFAPETVSQCGNGKTLVCQAMSLSSLQEPPAGACECRALPRATRLPQPVRHQRRGARH